MTDPASLDAATARTTLAGMLRQYTTPPMLVTAAQLGLADRLAEAPQTADALAAATGAHPSALLRLLRALAGLGVFAQDAQGHFTLTPLAEPLRTGVPGSLRDFALYAAIELRAWGDLLYGVQSGRVGAGALR